MTAPAQPTHTQPTHTQPTQTRYPWRATTRTAAAALIGALTLLPIVAVTTGLDTTPAVAQVVVVATAVTRVLALPAVDGWLHTYLPWLAATPKMDPAG